MLNDTKFVGTASNNIRSEVKAIKNSIEIGYATKLWTFQLPET